MDGLVIGLDLCDAYTHVSVSGIDKVWAFPTVICRKKAENCWCIGEEAYGANLSGNGVIVDKLLTQARKAATATIAEVKYTGEQLLQEYLKLVIRQVTEDTFGRRKVREEAAADKRPEEQGQEDSEEKPVVKEAPASKSLVAINPALIEKNDRLRQLVITVPDVDSRLMDVMMYASDALQIPRNHFHVISHGESFLFYVLSQKKEVWSNQVGMFDLSAMGLRYYEMKVQRGLKQSMVLSDDERMDESFNLDVLESASGAKLADKILCSCGDRMLGKKPFSSILLTGRGFEKPDWAVDFTRLACKRRKVYVEPYLFVKGALFKAADYEAEETAYPYVFICEGRLKSSVSMNVMHNDKPTKLVIAMAGDNWYEDKSTLEFILDGQNNLVFEIQSLDSRKPREEVIDLSALPERPNRTTRVQLKVGFTDEYTMLVMVSDRGFGELYPASDIMIRREVTL